VNFPESGGQARELKPPRRRSRERSGTNREDEAGSVVPNESHNSAAAIA
jgi:hypothetical protein